MIFSVKILMKEKWNDGVKSAVGTPPISETLCWCSISQPLNCRHVPVVSCQSASGLNGRFDNWSAQSHKISTTLEIFYSRLLENRWRLAFFFMYSVLMFKDCNYCSQWDLVRLSILILHGYDFCCVKPAML